MTQDEYRERRKTERYMDEALSVSVKISSEEKMKLVVNDLLAKRNACNCEILTTAMDTVLLGWFLTEEELVTALEAISKRAS